MQTPWAILLCKFKDDTTTEPYSKQRFEELFTSSGAGKLNMVDFFLDMSHGVLDLSGSKVFGWFTLDKNRSEYQRSAVIGWARQKAIDEKVPVSDFFSVVVFMNVPTDLFAAVGFGPANDGVVVDDGRSEIGMSSGMSSLSPSILGQEMGHVYGLNHSRAYGSDADYMDAWDVMSTANAFMAPHPTFTDRDVRGRPVFLLGPGLNAANMWNRNWLDRSRVWTAGDTEFGSTVQLRPLHRRDLPGYLAARVGPFFFELRVPELWDAGIGQDPVVLVHDYLNGNSYQHPSESGSWALTAPGDLFEWGDAADPLAPLVRVEVSSINFGKSPDRTATLKVTRRQDRRPTAGPAQVIVGVDSDGGGLILVGGKIVKVPPHSPYVDILENLVVLQESESISHGAAGDLMRRGALESIIARANAQLNRMLSYRVPSPPRQEQTLESEQV